MKPQKDIAEQLKRAIAEQPLSLNELSRACGVDVSVLCRFLNGQRGLNLESAGKLAAFFGLELTKKRR